MQIALVEDDPDLGPMMVEWLQEAGHRCELFATGGSFRTGVARQSHDLLILDRMLPDTSGDEVLEWVREHLQWHVPVIIVSARDTEQDIVKGLELGADDYVVKPVRRNELLARIAAIARRLVGGQNVPVEGPEFEPYRVDLTQRVIRFNGRLVELTSKEFELAVFFFRNAGRPISRTHILNSVWGREPGTSSRTVDTHVSRLRAKLHIRPENGWRLRAVFHYGYRLDNLRLGAADRRVG